MLDYVESSKEWEPIYPRQLLPGKWIHNHIPHMPLAKTESNNWTIPVGEAYFDEEPALVGLLVHRSVITPDHFNLRIFLNEDADYPRSIAWGAEVHEPLIGFVIQRDNPIHARSVASYTETGVMVIHDNIEETLAMRGLFLASIDKAIKRFSNYEQGSYQSLL